MELFIFHPHSIFHFSFVGEDKTWINWGKGDISHSGCGTRWPPCKGEIEGWFVYFSDAMLWGYE